jgi:hypothetical protein
VDVSQLASGVYLLQVTSADGAVGAKRFLVK